MPREVQAVAAEVVAALQVLCCLHTALTPTHSSRGTDTGRGECRGANGANSGDNDDDPPARFVYMVWAWLQ